MTLLKKYYSGHRKATEEEGDPVITGQEIWNRNMDAGLLVELEEDGGRSTRQS